MSETFRTSDYGLAAFLHARGIARMCGAEREQCHIPLSLLSITSNRNI
jgi:hypothetical protein